MSRHERDFRNGAEEPLGDDDLRTLLNAPAQGALTRQDAMARYLSGSDGWALAQALLGGAFARNETALRERKGD